MKVEQLIHEKISSLSTGQKKVAEYILQHLDSFSYSTLAKLSKDFWANAWYNRGGNAGLQPSHTLKNAYTPVGRGHPTPP